MSNIYILKFLKKEKHFFLSRSLLCEHTRILYVRFVTKYKKCAVPIRIFI